MDDEGKIAEAMRAFDEFLATVRDDPDELIDEESGLTGAHLHEIRRRLDAGEAVSDKTLHAWDEWLSSLDPDAAVDEESGLSCAHLHLINTYEVGD